MVLVDCTSRVLSEANMTINTPYYKGEVLALCLEKPLVDLIVGNIPGDRERTDPDINWVPTLAVPTRAQSRQLDQSETPKTPEIISLCITPAQICNAQKEDPSLKKIRQCVNLMKLDYFMGGHSLRRMIYYTGSSVHPLLSVVRYVYS